MKTEKMTTKDWILWCEELWKESGKQWIERTGQDHFYRQHVVLPALCEVVEGKEFETLVDIGSGDGYTTNLLLTVLDQQKRLPQQIVLIDRSFDQLEKAKTSSQLFNAKTVVADVTTDDWSGSITHTPEPRLFLSTFVYQEIPNISSLFKTTSDAMRESDLCLSIIVNPEYSALLRSENKVEFVSTATSEEGDWDWAGRYPIGVENGTIYLPHFQRTLERYKTLAGENGLFMHEPIFCSVPDTEEARKIFGETIYGNQIINTPSSVLLIFTKK